MLKKLFYPKSVALIGASSTPGKLGFDILANLVQSDFKGEIYPVNPNAEEILGKKVYSNVLKIASEIDLAIIAVPAKYVSEIIKQCANKNIQNIVVISAGFKESGLEGEKMENEIINLIKNHNINLIGPNCLGILNSHIYLNASFAEGMPKKGKIALISQSGAMAVAITDWALGENIGFSKIVSLGNKAGVNENDLLEYLESDKDTKVIMLYLESFSDGVKFMKIANKVAQKKTIIVFKSGVSEAGSKAVASHTGSLAGSDTAVETALKQCGVIRAKTIEDFFDYARIFGMQPLPKGCRVAIITNAGGPGVIATDSIDKSKFLQMAQFSEQTSLKLKESLPPTANIKNPVDIIGDALADRYQSAFSAVFDDKNVDMLLVILTPQIMTQKEATVKSLIHFNEKYPNLPVLTAFMGGKNIEYAAKKLGENSIPNFIYPTRAVRCMEAMVKLQNWRNKKTFLIQKNIHIKSTLFKREINQVIKEGKNQLPQILITKILESYKITVPKISCAKSAKEAIKDADLIGYPVALKISSDEVLHKTDVGGVRLAIKNKEEVVKAYNEIIKNIKKQFPKAKIKGVLVQKMYHMGREVIIGMKRDSIFGPLIMFGLGGIYVEVMKDVSFRVAPFSKSEALEMINEVKAIKLLKGVRGEAPADIKTISDTIIKISQLIMDYPEIKELDINPLLVFNKGEGVVALDARFLI